MKQSKYIKLNYVESKGKKQYRITLPIKMVTKLGWKAKDKLKIWINRKRHIEIRKKL